MRRWTAAMAVLLAGTLLAGFAGPLVPDLNAAPAALRFENVTAQVGINAAAVDPKNPTGSGDWGVIAVADYDGDGWDDILLNTHPGFKLYRNNGNGTFTQVALPLPAVVTNYNDHRHILLWCDIDLDGDDDLIIGTGFDSATRVNLWMRNDGNGTFANIAPALGVEDPGSNDWAATCADIDRNGWPDVLFARNTMASLGSDLPVERVWMNYATQFREEGWARGFVNLTRAKKPYGLQFADLNGDGYPDGAGTGNNYNAWFLARGDGTYRLTAGKDEPIASLSPYLHDADFADFNGDGRIDAAVVDTFTTSGENYIANVACNTGGFKAAAPADGMRWCWHAPLSISANQDPRSLAIGDFDNDGDVDMFLTHQGGMKADNKTAKGSDWFFVNDGTGKFTEAAKAVGLQGPVGTRYGGGGAAVIDYDMDGRLDLIVGYNALYFPGPFWIYRNTTPPANWIGFRLKAPLTLGTIVRVESCGKQQVQQLTARTGWLAQDSRNVHFGLGDCQGPVSTSVTWPDGERTEATLSPNAYHTLTRGDVVPPPAPVPPAPSPPTPPPSTHGSGSIGGPSPTTSSSHAGSAGGQSTPPAGSAGAQSSPSAGSNPSGGTTASTGPATESSLPVAPAALPLSAWLIRPKGGQVLGGAGLSRSVEVTIQISGGRSPYTALMRINGLPLCSVQRSLPGEVSCPWNVATASGKQVIRVTVTDATGTSRELQATVWLR